MLLTAAALFAAFAAGFALGVKACIDHHANPRIDAVVDAARAAGADPVRFEREVGRRITDRRSP